MAYKEWCKERDAIMDLIPYAEDFPLINNYGWEWRFNDKTYNVRHVLNCYGAEVDYWMYLDCSKIGTPGCSKYFDSFDEAFEFLKTKPWEVE